MSLDAAAFNITITRATIVTDNPHAEWVVKAWPPFHLDGSRKPLATSYVDEPADGVEQIGHAIGKWMRDHGSGQ